MTIEAAPTVTAKSAAICGSSVSAARTIAWLAKLASPNAKMAHFGLPAEAAAGAGGGADGGDDVDSIGGGGLSTAPPDSMPIGRNRPSTFTMIDKTYTPSEVEGRIYAAWEGAQAFRAGRPERKAAAPYSIVIPPPNVTGSLPLGHPPNNTLQDILARFERMRGKDVLWQPGTDHAGIATQMGGERQLGGRQKP